MDEIPLTFDMQPNHTINNTGEKAARIRMSRNEKNCATVVLVCWRRIEVETNGDI